MVSKFSPKFFVPTYIVRKLPVVFTQTKIMPSRRCCKPKCAPPRHTKCNKTVDVKLDYCPKARVKRRCARPASFDVVLDLCAKPTCCIRQKCETKSLGSCKQQCVFTVDLNCDFDCSPCIVKRECNAGATFDLEVDIDSTTTCKARPSRC